MNEENGNLDLGELLSSETANNAARLFLSYINSTTTISASYALVIILGISLALLALLGLAYMTASAIFTGNVKVSVSQNYIMETSTAFSYMHNLFRFCCLFY
jgi:hypothetical protein